VRVCDPPRQARETGEFVGLDEIIEECDVISLHTPLILEGEHATFHLLDQARLERLRPGAWLINASRGAVVDNAALREQLAQRPDIQAVLDVWEGEPQVDVALAELCWIATPHIAGYSLDGKLRGTAQIYQAFCASRGLEPKVELAELMPETPLRGLSFANTASPEDMLATICRAVYDPRRDDAAFRRSLAGDDEQRRAGFDRLRKQYPPRREIEGLEIEVGSHAQLQQIVRALGCRLKG
ncbi:DUF3410 domain-containing protein, partial [Stutzerimonas nitrititolerans]|uniref:DUF3410 domain-containing protein n=1 Tax=Stutzerimonas nitrititolerans TaxID=2482751 RepID=UPI00289FB25B